MTKKQYKTSLFIFRRDLRIPDNTALIHALTQSTSVIPIFIFDPIQINNEKNAYYSHNAVQFMVESLKDLANSIKEKNGRLYLFHGETEVILKKIIKNTSIDALFINYDYTPFAQKRDLAIAKLCAEHGIDFHSFHDELLIGDPASIMTKTNNPYQKFTPFFRESIQKKVAQPINTRAKNWYTKTVKGSKTTAVYKKILPTENPDIKVHGGRKNSLKILKALSKYKDYSKDRNYPALDATTHLSASHKFGTVSIRESYHAIKKALGSRTQLIAELYWRDFYTYIAFHNPYVFGKAYKKKYSALQWSKSKKNFQAWCDGNTGFPIVDAGMRQLNTTGWMHNRVRMIVASFLTKDLHINWQWGEKYFAQQLVDYDPCVNNGSWQWAASTGCDAQPYFRIFNPWTQQKKFDPECIYIKQWTPELTHIPVKTIHTWFKDKHEPIKDYPHPIINHDEERKITLTHYKKL